jgi:hypothetical protein
MSRTSNPPQAATTKRAIGAFRTRAARWTHRGVRLEIGHRLAEARSRM